MKIGAHKKKLLAVILSLLLIPLLVSTASGESSFLSSKLTAGPDNANSNNEFGHSVAVSGDTVVVGDDVENAAYVFEKDKGEWKQVARLTTNGSTSSIYFGMSVAIDDDTIVVGAPFDNFPLGAAYVFKREGGIWDENPKTQLSASDSPLFLGWSLAFDGSTIVVGTAMSNSVYVYNSDGDHWPGEEARLTPSDAEEIDRFGWSVAVSGNRIVVGAPWDGLIVQDPDDPDGTIELLSAGSAYVFEFDGNSWLEKTPKLTAEDPAADDLFGFSVAIDDNTVVVGARKDSSHVPDPGAAYVFEYDGNSWLEKTPKLTASDSADNDEFGYSVAIKGSTLVVGAPMVDSDSDVESGPGALYVFKLDGNIWSEKAKLTAGDAGDPPKKDQFGLAVAVNGTSLIAGATLADAEMPEAGAAYVFETNEPPTAEAVADPEQAKEGDTVLLKGSGEDPDGDSQKLEYQWKQGEDDALRVDLVDPDKEVASFLAPELSEGCAELSFQLTVIDEKGQPSEPAPVNVTIGPNNSIHAKLGGKHRHWLYWHKYSFYGHENDQVVITLEADPNGWHRGSKTTLILKDKIKGARLFKTDRGGLPSKISATLPADGTYAIYVLKQPWFWSWWRHNRFEGDYILSLEGTCGKLVNGSGCKER